jgi:spore coat protein U-like protein
MQMIARMAAICLISLGILFLGSMHAYAAKACTVTVANINFGNSVNVLPGTAVTVNGSLVLSCTGFPNNEKDLFCMNIGSGADFSGSQRQMKSGVNKINYDLYQDSGYSTLWGSWQTGFDTSGMGLHITASGTTINTSFPIYGKLFVSQQTAIPGAYSSAFPNSNAGVDVKFIADAGGALVCPQGGSTSSLTGFSALATLTANCTISVASANLTFATSTLLNSPVNATSTIGVQCTNTTPYNVGLNAGTTTGGTTTTRLMANGANTVSYKMYQDSGHTTNWGNSVGTDTESATGTGNQQNITVYGQVPSQSSPAPATYNDTVTVTVTY